MIGSFSSKRIVLTGGNGFLGSHVAEELRAAGCRHVVMPRSHKYDLRRSEAVGRLYQDAHPDIVIHLAAVVGRIGANRANPGSFFYDNLMMGVETMEQGRQHRVEKFVAVG